MCVALKPTLARLQRRIHTIYPPPHLIPRSSTAREAADKAEADASTAAVRAAVVAEYSKGKTTVRALAGKHGLSKSAVQRLISGKLIPGVVRGRPTILPPDVEENIVKSLIRCAQAHVGLSPHDVRAAVGFHMHKAGLVDDDRYMMGKGWYESFMNRHKHQLPRSISKARAPSASTAVWSTAGSTDSTTLRSSPRSTILARSGAATPASV